MKTIKYLAYMLAAVLPISLASCAEELEYTPGEVPDGAQVYFPTTTQTAYNVDDNTTSITVPVMRGVSDEALNVNILADLSGIDAASQSWFTVPSSVSFAAGESETALTISVNAASMVEDVEYSIGLLINDEANTTPYGYNTLYVTLVKPSAWTSLGMGTWYENGYFIFNEPVEVEIFQNEVDPASFRVSMMSDGDYLYSNVGSQYFEFNLLEPGETLNGSTITMEGLVYFSPFDIGIENSNYGETVWMYHPAHFSSMATEASWTYNKVVQYQANGLPAVVQCAPMYYLPNYGGGWDYTQEDGVLTITFPGAEVKDYTLSAKYSGMRVAEDNVTASAVIDFTYGADVTGISYTFVSGDMSSNADDIISSVVAGTAENIYEVENFVPGGEHVSIEADLVPGVYTVVAVPADDAGALSAANAVAYSFYFPGVGGTTAPECDINAGLYKVSEYADAAEYVDQCPDYSSVVYEISGSEIKSAKMYLNTTDVINSIESMGMTVEEVVDAYGSDISYNLIQELNTYGKTWNILINLNPSTSYTFVVSAENIYGEKALVISEPLTTAGLPYSGELVIGEYQMECDFGGEHYENIFEVLPREDSETEFLVKNIGVANGASWYAEYDSENSTLTLSGVEEGYEDFGNQFGAPYYYYDSAETMYYGFYSYASETSAGKDPCVFAVDPVSKELSTLNNDFCVALQDAESFKAVGFLSYFTAGIEVSRVQSSTSGYSIMSELPSVAGKVGCGNLGVAMNRNVKCLQNTTLSVNTRVCEPLDAVPSENAFSVRNLGSPMQVR